MARGLHSLRQRSSNRNDSISSDSIVLPLTMPQHHDAGAAGDLRSRGGQHQHLQSRRRKKVRSRQWERQFKLRVILTNIMICLVFVCGIGLVLHRVNNRPLSKMSSFWISHSRRSSSSSLPATSTSLLQHEKKKVDYDFVCKNHPDKRGIYNDDYCDCPDGSDEPHTSACSHVLVGKRVFSCNNINKHQQQQQNSSNKNEVRLGKQHQSNNKYLFASRVKDGVIDCPNKADER